MREDCPYQEKIAQNTHQFEAGIGLQGRTQVMVQFLETTHLNDPMITPISRPSSSSQKTTFKFENLNPSSGLDFKAHLHLWWRRKALGVA